MINRKRKANNWQENRCTLSSLSLKSTANSFSEDWDDTEMLIASENIDYSVKVSMQFEQLTREVEVRLYTGLPYPEAFKCIFDFLSPKAQTMQYWRGRKQTAREAPNTSYNTRPGPERKLRLEQELLATLMKLKLGLLIEDLAFRFQVSPSTLSSIFITWVKLMSKELPALIIWPSRQQIRKHLPSCFRKLYPKVRCIIDCFECFTETPSGLDLAAAMWSEYKHHYTYKVLVAINGAFSYVSRAYGGRASHMLSMKYTSRIWER